MTWPEMQGYNFPWNETYENSKKCELGTLTLILCTFGAFDFEASVQFLIFAVSQINQQLEAVPLRTLRSQE